MHALARCFLVGAYIFYCARYATKPCKYFQLNAEFFDHTRGIFSKQQMDARIPEGWRLPQVYDDGVSSPPQYPVFLKPEWSQNAHGVYRAGDADELRKIRRKIKARAAANRAKYLAQQAAAGCHEYEIFTIRHHLDHFKYAALTVTQAVNAREVHPINSIHNPRTKYMDITDSFAPAQLQKFWELVQRIGSFAIARVSVKADSCAALLRGQLHVIEVNLFLPMPIHLLDARYSLGEVLVCGGRHMKALARATRHRDPAAAEQPVFIKSILYNRGGRLADFARRAAARFFQ